jgi:hypothetical protein
MPTIVQYTDEKPPENFYPWYIISPLRSGPCCFSDMVEIGETHREERWECVYKRCRRCGFAVQVILRQRPDEVLLSALRKDLALAFRRNPR